ncbi:MAG: hypothetical protein C4288_05695, partial [Leptolyngbya sp. ERB_1_1]
ILLFYRLPFLVIHATKPLLHQTILVTIAFYVVQWNVDIITKFLIISTMTVIVTLFVYELLVSRISMMRSLFGLK